MPNLNERPQERGENHNRVETRTHKRIDADRSPERTMETSKDAERIVIDFFNKYFRDVIKVRPASYLRDAESMMTATAHNIGVIADYTDREPAMLMEITTAKDVTDSIKQLKDHPSIKLHEGKKYEPSVPKIMIRLEPEAVDEFMGDYNFEKHPKLEQRILEDTIASLKFDLIKTRNYAEMRQIQYLLDVFSGQKDKLH